MCLSLFLHLLRAFSIRVAVTFFSVLLGALHYLLFDERALIAWTGRVQTARFPFGCVPFRTFESMCARMFVALHWKTNKVFNFDFIIYLETTWNRSVRSGRSTCERIISRVWIVRSRACVCMMPSTDTQPHYLMFNYCYVCCLGDRIRCALN